MARMINGVDIDKFLQLEGQILEPVPKEARQDYSFWRAIHLGAVALYYVKGNPALNSAWMAPHTHFRTDYQVALETARGMDYRLTQFAPQHAKELAQLTGIPEEFAYPSLVGALDESYNDGRLLEHLPSLYSYLEGPELFPRLSDDAPHSPSGGFFLRGRLTADMLDPYSRQAIEDIFKLEQ